MRPEKAYAYRCSNDRCREVFYFYQKQPPEARIACPGCMSILEFLRPPSVTSQPVSNVLPRPFTKPVNSDGTTPFLMESQISPEWNPDPNEPIHVDPTNPQSLIADRSHTHGGFEYNAALSQEIKEIIRGYSLKLSPIQREALDMICTKISRILSGNPNYIDHWADIAGYATLIVNDLTEAEVLAGERPAYDPPVDEPAG